MANTFKVLAEEWLKRQTDLLPGTVKRHQGRLERFVYQHIGNKPIDQITAPELPAVLFERLLLIEEVGHG